MRDRIVVFAVLLIAATLLGPSVALGQPSKVAPRESTAVPFNVGLVPYVDINSHFTRPRNNVSLDGVAGAAFRLDGAAVSGVSGFVWDGARGVQLAGVSGYVGGDLAGAQIGGVVSATRGAVSGLQAAGVVSYAGRVSGAQIGVVNVARGPMNGLQLSGVVGYAGQVGGAQIGLINIGGRVKGVQLGLINVADEVDGATLGLVNVVRKDGRHQIELSTSNTAAFSAATKLGTKYVYSILGIGLQPARGQVAWMPTVGLGGSIPILERGFVNVEVRASAVNIGAEFDRDSVLGQLRLAGGYRVADKLALFAGPVLDVLRSSSGKRLSHISYLPTLATWKQGKAPVDMGIGFAVGLQAL